MRTATVHVSTAPPRPLPKFLNAPERFLAPRGRRRCCTGAMDHYQTLGLSGNATKEEIKEAFRRCALESHPDRHSRSTQEVRDQALLRFKQASAAYEVLSDDRKRADYDLRRIRPGGFGGRTGAGDGGSSTYRGYGYGGGGGGGRYYGRTRPAFDWELVFRYLMSRKFLLNVALASALLGGTVAIQRSGDAIWKMNNTGKSFEESMEKIRVQQKEKG